MSGKPNASLIFIKQCDSRSAGGSKIHFYSGRAEMTERSELLKIGSRSSGGIYFSGNVV